MHKKRLRRSLVFPSLPDTTLWWDVLSLWILRKLTVRHLLVFGSLLSFSFLSVMFPSLQRQVSSLLTDCWSWWVLYILRNSSYLLLMRVNFCNSPLLSLANLQASLQFFISQHFKQEQFSGKWMQLERIMLSKSNQLQKGNTVFSPLICGS